MQSVCINVTFHRRLLRYTLQTDMHMYFYSFFACCPIHYRQYRPWICTSDHLDKPKEYAKRQVFLVVVCLARFRVFVLPCCPRPPVFAVFLHDGECRVFDRMGRRAGEQDRLPLVLRFPLSYWFGRNLVRFGYVYAKCGGLE